MKRAIFILVPSPHPSGPVKGAFALANALAPMFRVVLAYLKDGPGVEAKLDDRVEEIYLATIPGLLGRLRVYKRHLLQAGGRQNVVSLSMCFSADVINRFCIQQALICSSVRGNLLQNYRHDYGLIGILLAIFHLSFVASFDYVVAMTKAMSAQIYSITGATPQIIGNFVDEQALERFRTPVLHSGQRFYFVFVGSLSSRKQPTLVVQAIFSLVSQGYDIKLDMIGDGPLRDNVLSMVLAYDLQNHIYLHGHVATPYPLIANADALILPSRSEGISRAALEALHLGVPCVLRDVDGNSELLCEPSAGELFSNDCDLPRAMIEAARRGRTRLHKSSLLPSLFRKNIVVMQYLQLFHNHS